MLIVCPSCASEYAVDSALLRPNGRKLRCAACREVFFIPPPGEDEDDSEGGFQDAFDDDMAFDESDPVAASLARRMRGGGREVGVEASTGPAGPRPDEAGPRRRLSLRPPGGGALARLAGKPAAALAAMSRRVSGSAAKLPVTLVLSVILIGGALGAFLGRESVVRAAPEAALLYEMAGLPVNLRGLELMNVVSARGLEEAGEILTVEGVVANRTERSHMVPPVTVVLRDADGRPLYTWEVQAPRATLHPGESAPFRARLVAPPAEARQVLVRFSPARGVAGVGE